MVSQSPANSESTPAKRKCRPPSTLDEKFAACVSATGPIPGSPCLIWQSCVDAYGYGVVWIGGKLGKAHRVSYERSVGPIPEGMHICHRCDVPGCVRPEHLFAGTDRDNQQDCSAKGRRNSARGERSGSAKLTTEKVVSIRERYAAGGVTTRALGSEFGVEHNVILKVIHRRTWKHVLSTTPEVAP